MTHLLFENRSFGEDWCFNAFKEYLYAHQTAAVLPLGFRREAISTPKEWQAYYNKQRGPYCRAIEAGFARYGIPPQQIRWVNYFEDSKADARRAVEEADILYLCGGVPELIMERLEELRLVSAVEGHTGLFLGDGAGALVQLMQYHSTGEDEGAFAYRKGLRLLTGFQMELSYAASPVQKKAIERVRGELGLPVYAVEPGGALIVKDGRVEPVGKVQVFY